MKHKRHKHPSLFLAGKRVEEARIAVAAFGLIALALAHAKETGKYKILGTQEAGNILVELEEPPMVVRLSKEQADNMGFTDVA